MSVRPEQGLFRRRVLAWRAPGKYRIARYTNKKGLAGALATCRTRCKKACDSASILPTGRGAVLERILGSMSKKELHGCCDRICPRQRSRVAEQVKGACWLRLRRQAHTRLDGADDVNVRFFASVMCRHVPYRTTIAHTHTYMTRELSRETSCCSAPTATLHCCTALRLRSLFAFLLSATPVRIAA